jgi:hypothetical protein
VKEELFEHLQRRPPQIRSHGRTDINQMRWQTRWFNTRVPEKMKRAQWCFTFCFTYSWNWFNFPFGLFLKPLSPSHLHWPYVTMEWSEVLLQFLEVVTTLAARRAATVAERLQSFPQYFQEMVHTISQSRIQPVSIIPFLLFLWRNKPTGT